MSYKIDVQTLSGKILTFKGINEFDIEDSMVCFIDSVTGLEKRFPTERTNIEEERSLKGGEE